MAQPPSRQPVSSHYLAQAGLTVALARLLAALWPSVDLQRLPATLPPFQRHAAALVDRFSRASATLSVRDYQRARAAAGVRSPFTVPHSSPPPPEQIGKSLQWATGKLWDPALLEPGANTQAALDTAATKVEGAASRLVLDVGRQTTIDAVAADKQARAWAREARPDCCYFCALLAGRGAVYSSAQAAGQDNAFHDHCHCQVVPVFGAYEKTAQARAWTRQYHDLRRELGYSPSLLEWRQHYDAARTTTDHPQLAGH